MVYAEYEENILALLADIKGEDGDSSSAEEDEVCGRKRPELVKRVEGLHRLHCSLAEHFMRSSSRSSPSSIVGEATRYEQSESNPESSMEEDPELEMWSRRGKGRNGSMGDEVMELEPRISCSEQTLAIIEENCRQLNELTRRNEEKRGAIKHLWSQVEKLRKENSGLRRQLHTVRSKNNNINKPRSSLSRLKTLFMSALCQNPTASKPHVAAQPTPVAPPEEESDKGAERERESMGTAAPPTPPSTPARMQCVAAAWRAMVMAATLLRLCSARVLEPEPFRSDMITKLPGQPPVSFQQFSGYITVDQLDRRALFYYFAEAEVDPSTKPLVLWLNGGNTASSIFSIQLPPILFFWSHGLISDSTYRIFTSACNYSRYVSEYYRGSLSSVCQRVMSQVTRETSRFVDKYDVTLDVCISSVLSQSMVLSPQRVDVCVEDETVRYLNRRDVQEALHVHLDGVTKWTVCSSVLEYELLNLEVPTISVVGSLVKSGIPVLVYSGDQDSVIPLTGSRTLVQRLANELGLKTTVPYRVWFEGEQVGGWTQVYGDVLSFATVRGASHEAPFSQPERSLVLFRAFLQRRPLPETFTYAP
ncbi:hypothetical protein GW17_00044517 [Ensete ventricosum]|nr:hypothetical protein GW17_00044517 [Ensete ventricosum]